VENAVAPIIAAARKALRSTGFRRMTPAHYDALQWRAHPLAL